MLRTHITTPRLELQQMSEEFFNQSLDGEILYDIILQNTDPEVVIQQLDIGHMLNGGAKAVDVIKKYPGRFQSLHVKDEIKSQEGEEEFESTILGKGVVGVKEVIDLGAKKGGSIHFIIEQEAYQGKTPMECIQEDYEHMKSWGY